ncbi:MAG: hypothetical protein JRH20_09610 [Deltaproteobacteria bacterium]|nr:hypothetical protein [Deltaproteobacteria bacterium]
MMGVSYEGGLRASGRLMTLLLCAQAACSTAPQPPTSHSSPAVQSTTYVTQEPEAKTIIEGAAEALGRGLLQVAETRLAPLFIVEPDHLEGRVLAAMIRQKSGQGGRAAWQHVEQVIVIKGKLAPFVRRETLLSAAHHYLAAGTRGRAELFLEELWRRFPRSDAAAQGQLLVAHQSQHDQRWADVRDACRELARVQPKHPGNARCKALSVVADRLERVGQLASERAPRWRWEHPTPQANDLEALWMDRQGMVVAVGEAGTIIEGRRAGGLRWVPRVTRWSLRAVAGARLHALYAVGDGGIVLARDEKGWRVLRAPRPQAADLHGVWSPRAGELWAVGEGGVALHFHAGRWKEHQAAQVTLNGVWGVAGKVFAVGDEGTLATFDGASWMKRSSDAYEHLRGIFGRGQDRVLVVGDRRTVVFFNGKKAEESVQGLADLRDVWFDKKGQAWAVGGGGQILRSGRRPLDTWRTERSPTAIELRAIAGDGRGRIMAVGVGGTILERRGGRWRLLAGGVSQVMVDVSCGGSERLSAACLALGSRGRLLTRSRGAWRATHLPVVGDYHALWRGKGRVVAVGARGLLVVGDGRGFRKVDVPTQDDLFGVTVCGDKIIAVGSRGLIVEAKDGKARVSRAPTGHVLRAVAGCSPVVVVGGRGTILVRSKGGSWSRERTGSLRDLSGVWVGKRGVAYAVGSGGTILRRGARRWWPMKAGLSQPLLGIWGRSAGDLFAVARYGQVVHFDGKGWRQQRSPAACLTAVSGNSEGVWGVGCNGGVIHLKPQRKPQSVAARPEATAPR